MRRALTPREVWQVPVLLGVLSLVGLVAALVADGLGDALSWVALAVPAAVCAWGFWRPRRPASPASRVPAPRVGARPLGPRASVRP